MEGEREERRRIPAFCYRSSHSLPRRDLISSSPSNLQSFFPSFLSYFLPLSSTSTCKRKTSSQSSGMDINLSKVSELWRLCSWKLFPPVTAVGRRFRLLLQFPIRSSQAPITTLSERSGPRSEIYTSSRVRPFPLLLLPSGRGSVAIICRRRKRRRRRESAGTASPFSTRKECIGRAGWRRRFVAQREKEGDRREEEGKGSEGRVSCSDWN